MKKELETYLPKFEDCLQHEVSFCTAACPLGLDIDKFISRLEEGRFNAAYKAYRDAAGFPFIAAAICDAPCRSVCPLAGENGGAIEMNRLEQAAVAHATRLEPTRYNLPPKKKSAAIIGAGLSGMACALRLATKKYTVTIYEKSGRIGGALWEQMDPAVFAEDFERQLAHLDYDLRLDTEVTALDEIAAGVDAVYVATGAGGTDFGLAAAGGPGDHSGSDSDHHFDDPGDVRIGETGIFFGGALRGRDPIHALADGLNMATAIDNFTMTGRIEYPQPRHTDAVLDPAALRPSRTIVPAAEVYSEEEAAAEAKRCLHCQCNACQLHCDLTRYLHKWPLRLRDEIQATTTPGRSELKATPAIRLIHTCTHCGLCRETCPQDIDLDGLIQAARFRMHQIGRTPWAFNDFFLRDMDFNHSDAAYLCRKSPHGAARIAFFPGCQLAASAPELVLTAYRWLLEHEPDCGVFLGCCGVPARWAGSEERHLAELSRIHDEWERLGRPMLVLACPTCRNQLREYLPDIETVFLYEKMDEWGIEVPSAETVRQMLSAPAGDAAASAAGEDDSALTNALTAAVFDPCATQADEPVRQAVRRLCEKMGVTLRPLPLQERWSACCSYGGQGMIADPDFTRQVRRRRIGESDAPYITYCINCRDAFAAEGKTGPHLLNLLFGIPPRLDTVSARRRNRIGLKERLLREFWQESPEPSLAGPASQDLSAAPEVKPCAERPIRLEISDELRQKLSSRYILEEEITNVVAYCDRTGRSLYDTERGTYSGYRKIGSMTYWAEYRKTAEDDHFTLVNAWSHRMEIELEMVWNGKKVEHDL